MELYAIFRRDGWDPDEIEQADARSSAELQKRSGQMRKIRSYVLEEPNGRVGTVCLYQAASPDAIRAHGRAANVPIDDIVPVTAIDVWRPDPDLVSQAPA